jgi:isoaspartyl peptidase/L-asparaginase-like protein (Ntn-hydrolase superfamily)
VTAIVVHGGAGAVPVERHALLRASVRAAAAAGNHVLVTGGSALEAVVAAVRVMEDDPELNAGTGSVLTIDGTVETDAAVMTGHDRRVGAVGAVPNMGRAVELARAVLERGEHVLLSGEGALAFAREVGVPIAPAGSLVTERQRERLHAFKAARDHSGASEGAGRADDDSSDSHGTVGAVARDRHGHFAAATSTGGMIGKRPGRIGDSPIVGAGTWADTGCAISATGDGEAILRVTLARLVPFGARDTSASDPQRALDRSARAALAELVAITGGSAGLIAIDGASRVTLRLSRTMPVAWVDSGGAGDSLGDDA